MCIVTTSLREALQIISPMVDLIFSTVDLLISRATMARILIGADSTRTALGANTRPTTLPSTHQTTAISTNRCPRNRTWRTTVLDAMAHLDRHVTILPTLVAGIKTLLSTLSSVDRTLTALR